MPRPNLEDAILLAATAHRGQVDKGGHPYILHVIRIMFQLHSDEEKMVGVLHDLIEDTSYTLDDLRQMGYSENILIALDCLTRRAGENYEEFIERAKANPVARRVKTADLLDNLNVSRMPNLNEDDLRRIQRYHSALLRLQ